MENYHIIYDPYLDVFVLFLFFGDESFRVADLCRSDDVDCLRRWLRKFDVSYIHPLAVEMVRDL